MGMFDDLIPAQGVAAQTGASPMPGMFDDLIPKGHAFGSDEYIDALAKKHGADPDTIRRIVESERSGQVLKGIPIAGGLVEKAGAGAAALAAPLTGAGVPGPSIAERYGKNLALMSEIASDYEKAHPVLSTDLERRPRRSEEHTSELQSLRHLV